jgi:hypothetical protein
MYRVTGKDGIGESEIRVNAGKYQYMLAHTSTYQYIPVHCLILTGDYVYRYIPVYDSDR